MNSADRNESKTVNLCRTCEESLRRGNYTVRTVAPGSAKTIRTCGFCRHRTSCGQYEVSGRHASMRKEKKSATVAEEIAEEIRDRNL